MKEGQTDTADSLTDSVSHPVVFCVVSRTSLIDTVATSIKE